MAPKSDAEVLKNIQNYVELCRQQQEQGMDTDQEEPEDIESHLEKTVQELQHRLQRQQEELEKLRRSHTPPISTTPSADPRERLLQLRAITAAYEKATNDKPILPPAKSIIPSLLATRVVTQATKDAKAAIPSLEDQIASLTQQVSHERTALSDAQLLQAKLSSRNASLLTQRTQQRQAPAAQAAQLVAARAAQQRAFAAATQRLQAQLDAFIAAHVAALLAAEELGGPVAGDRADVDDAMLDAGFTAAGAPAKTAASGLGKAARDARQRRIDDIWGPRAALEDSAVLDDESAADADVEPKVAAGNELVRLIARLIRGLEGDSEEGVYVRLERDSAAARFLVRSRVARFHGKDASRLRMTDFGRDLDE